MAKCKDGRKHIVVSEYKTKTGANISSYERSCPRSKPKQSNDSYFCCVCGEECCIDEINDVNIKGEAKSICNECVDTIHGLM